MTDTIESLAQRVRHLEDLEAIRHTWRDYCTRLDAADWPALADIYTEDGVLEMVGLDALLPGIDGEYRGRHAIIDTFYKPAIAGACDLAAGLFSTGHLSTNMQIEHLGDEATTLAYFFEIVANTTVLIGTYQHRMRREAERWRFKRLRITVRYHAVLEARDIGGCSLAEVLAQPI
ncbi:MAG: nuclear transport factor 2 family protein [Gammaproteobacteria bacterium]